MCQAKCKLKIYEIQSAEAFCKYPAQTSGCVYGANYLLNLCLIYIHSWREMFAVKKILGGLIDVIGWEFAQSTSLS